MSAGDELRARLHPATDPEIPVPGFPSHQELIDWARTQPFEEIREAAVDMLLHDRFPQQYACMALLRALGVTVEADNDGWFVGPGPHGDDE